MRHRAPISEQHGGRSSQLAESAVGGHPDAEGIATSPLPELEITRLHRSDMPECLSLACRSFEDFERDEDALQRWFDARITNNPWQQALNGIGVGARDHGKLVAFRVMFAQPWWMAGQSTVIAFAANTCIEPAYRGCGLGSRLIEESRALANLTGSTSAGHITQRIYAKQGFVAVGGDSNDFFRLRVSYSGSMRSRLGRVLGRLAGGTLDAVSRTERAIGDAPDFELGGCMACSDEFDLLWHRARAGYPSCLERSSRYLNWRLFEQPTYPLSLLALRDKHHRLRAYGIWHEVRYSPYVTCAVLRDLFTVDTDDEARRAFLIHAIRYWRGCGVTWANLEVASPRLTCLFESQGYEQLPSRGNRYHVYSREELGPGTVNAWFRSGLDGDYFDTRPPHGRSPHSRVKV